jgi:serine/threonine protein kinase
MILYNRGKIIGNTYEIIERLGASGQSVFYKCKLLNCDKRKPGGFFFLKIYHDINVADIDNIAKFFMYIRDSLKNNANYFCLPVVKGKDCLEIGVEDDSVFVMFPWVEGITLTEYLKKNTQSNLEIKSVVLGLLSACTALERSKIVHLDIKPDNIFISKINDKIYIKMIDLDIARIQNNKENKFCGIRSLGGTPCFRSPEQYSNDESNVSEKCDVFCLGIVLSMVLFRQYPFGDNDEASILNGPSALPDDIIHPVLKTIILRCLSPNPQKRPSIKELSFIFNQYAGTNFKYKKCGISVSDGNHSPYRYWQSVKLSGQDLRGFIHNLPSNPCIYLNIDQNAGLYSLSKISDEVEIKLFGKEMILNKPRFLSLSDLSDMQQQKPNISINGKDLYIYLEEE